MKVLLASDGSEHSEGAARFLASLELSGADEITVIHAISSFPFQDDKASYLASLAKIKQETGAKILDGAVDVLKGTMAKISTALSDGYPDRVIVDAASESNADLVVMGSRGLRGIRSLVVGSVTRLVALNSTKPVLVVKRPQWNGKRRVKILFATDGSDCSRATADIVCSIPFPADSEIVILNVIRSSFADIPPRFVMEVDDRVKDELARARTVEFEAADKIIEEARSHVGGKYTRVQQMKRVGDPAVEVLEAAAQEKADIIAVGCSGIRGVMGVLGSVSRHILNHSECSVLIGKT